MQPFSVWTSATDIALDDCATTTGRRTRISASEGPSERCGDSRVQHQRSVSLRPTQQSTIRSTCSSICCVAALRVLRVGSESVWNSAVALPLQVCREPCKNVESQSDILSRQFRPSALTSSATTGSPSANSVAQ